MKNFIKNVLDPPQRKRTPKPPNCRKMYMGNLSYNIDDDVIMEVFGGCGKIIGLRWLTHKDTGEFRVLIFQIFSFFFGEK